MQLRSWWKALLSSVLACAVVCGFFRGVAGFFFREAQQECQNFHGVSITMGCVGLSFILVALPVWMLNPNKARPSKIEIGWYLLWGSICALNTCLMASVYMLGAPLAIPDMVGRGVTIMSLLLLSWAFLKEIPSGRQLRGVLITIPASYLALSANAPDVSILDVLWKIPSWLGCCLFGSSLFGATILIQNHFCRITKMVPGQILVMMGLAHLFGASLIFGYAQRQEEVPQFSPEFWKSLAYFGPFAGIGQFFAVVACVGWIEGYKRDCATNGTLILTGILMAAGPYSISVFLGLALILWAIYEQRKETSQEDF